MDLQTLQVRPLDRLNDYQQEVLRTATRSRTKWNTVVAALGLCGESGEAAEIVKKAVTRRDPLPRAAVALELGDALWYLTYLAHQIGYTLEEVARLNVHKLRTRYPNGFNSEDSRARVDLVVASARGVVPVEEDGNASNT